MRWPSDLLPPLAVAASASALAFSAFSFSSASSLALISACAPASMRQVLSIALTAHCSLHAV